MATIREALDDWGREAILVFFLTASWRKPIDFSEETMAQAAARRDTLRNAFTLEPAPVEESVGMRSRRRSRTTSTRLPRSRCSTNGRRHASSSCSSAGCEVFGLGSLAVRVEAPPEVAELAERRLRARAERDFETSDRLRDELAALGWQMRDEPGADTRSFARDA